jgi:branched-chain amino acid transport system substrate-binding protein
MKGIPRFVLSRTRATSVSRATRGAALAAMIALVAACGGGSTPSSSSSTSSTPFNVLIAGALSGATGALGAACVQGIQTSALSLNNSGGIMGHKVEIKTYDSQGNPTQAVSLLTQALNSGTTWNYTYSGSTSDEQVAEGPSVNKAKIIGVSNNGLLALGDPKVYPYHFLNSSNADVVSKFVVDYAQKQNFKKLALLTEDNAFGQQEHGSYSTALKAANIPFVDQVFSATAVDISPALLQLQSQGVDGVIWNALGTSIGYVLKSRAKVNFMVPFIGDLGVSSGDVVTLAGSSDALKNVVMQNWSVNVATPEQTKDAKFSKFLETLRSVAPTISQPIQQYANCYDGLQAYNIAAKQANSLDPDKVRSALEHLKVPSPSPLIVFPKGFGWTPQSHVMVNTPDQFAIVKPGALKDGQMTVSS